MNQKDCVGQTGIVGIFVLTAILAGAALFIPPPYYQKDDVYCESYPPQLCAKKGWHLGRPLWKQALKLQEKTDSSPVLTQQPTPDPTADWKTYTNTKEQFSFKYPSEWNLNLKEQKIKREGITILLELEIRSPAKELDDRNKMSLYELLVITYKGNKEKLTLAQEVNQLEPRSPGVVLKERNKLTVGGRDAEKLVFVQDTGEENTFVLLMNEGKIYLISFTAYFISAGLEEEFGEEFKMILDQILSTFKFTSR